MRRLRIFFRNFFGFTKTEANASIVLIFLLFVFAVLPRVYMRLAYEPKAIAVDSLTLLSWQIEVESAFKPKEQIAVSKTVDFEPFAFDPNTANQNTLLSLGFPPYIADRIVNYRNAGGHFSHWDDLLKIYGIDSSHVIDLQAYITISKALAQKKIAISPQEQLTAAENVLESLDVVEKEISLDLNQATAEELQTIKGIGPFYSERVIEYRKILGGYYSQEQLEEVYGLRQEAIDLLKRHTFIGEGADKNILINSDSIMLIAKHPYLSWNQARAIVSYREQHGDYQSSADIRDIKIIDDSLYQKILPYLSLDK